MHKIDWWKVASVALMAASAVLSFGHDLIEDKNDRGRPAGYGAGRSSAAVGRKEPVNAKKYRLLYGREIPI